MTAAQARHLLNPQNDSGFDSGPSEIDQFLFAITHDLKAGLRALAELPSWTEADLRADGYVIPSHIQEHLDMLKTSARDMTTLLDGLTDLARATHVPTEPMQCSLGELAYCIWEDMPGKRGALDVSAAQHRLSLPDAAMRRLLHVLFDNAMRHHDKKQVSIGVSSSLLGGKVVLRVDDDGPGIPVASREQVFAPLCMLRNREETGRAGLGLTLARKIVSHYNGQITIEDSRFRRGCAVVMSLPKAAVA